MSPRSDVSWSGVRMVDRVVRQVHAGEGVIATEERPG